MTITSARMDDTPAAVLLASLRAAGIRIWLADDGTPKVNPASQVEPTDWELLRQHREALLDLLWMEQPAIGEVSFRYVSNASGFTVDTLTGQIHTLVGGGGRDGREKHTQEEETA